MPTSKTYDGRADTGGSPFRLELLFFMGGGVVEVEVEKELDGEEPDLGNM
jgi:hypothetical protein